ncbi:hypothetical protein RHSIM_Rhsim07G0141200 [Rhododendron simsii]|uniref:PRONE domain-containing protein n=1 Tax=Rhododendron simsii TaxID=118357 RepID=A0A834LJ96_RHOSS|nr:hypothetical protein RHSIM_Rhsim07G0141200 [Rhododendron simsii]
MGWRLACFSKDREIIQENQDVDEREMIVTYNGLESCIQNSPAYNKESGMSRGDGITTDSINEEATSCCCSSNKNALGSVSSHWNMMKWFEQELAVEWEAREVPPLGFYDVTENPVYRVCCSDVEPMQERFAKLLLGDDITGGREGLSASLALSNAITNLAASVFGELWRLEPLPEERKSKWRTEMDWLLTPTKYMVELVPSKRIGANGRTMEIMTPKARADIQANLPALQKLDSMLIETLDSMVSAEFWYTEGGSWAEGRSRRTSSMRRWLVPLPQLPITGLSQNERAKMLNLGKVVHQIYKAAKSINETVLLQLPAPTIASELKYTRRQLFFLPKKGHLPRKQEMWGVRRDNATWHLPADPIIPRARQSGKESLGKELYRILSVDSQPVGQMLNSLNLKSEHSAIETINRLEAAVFAWKEKVTKQNGGKSPVQKAWSFKTNPILELEKIEVLMDKAEALIQLLRTIYPNLPQTFLEVVKIQYGRLCVFAENLELDIKACCPTAFAYAYENCHSFCVWVGLVTLNRERGDRGMVGCPVFMVEIALKMIWHVLAREVLRVRHCRLGIERGAVYYLKSSNDTVVKVGESTSRNPHNLEYTADVAFIKKYSVLFELGWDRVALTHNLGRNYILMFGLVGHLQFDLFVFDEEGCEVSYDWSTTLPIHQANAPIGWDAELDICNANGSAALTACPPSSFRASRHALRCNLLLSSSDLERLIGVERKKLVCADVGHSILEAYSRVLRNLAFKILSRIRDILQEDVLRNPHLHVPTYCFPGTSVTKNANSRVLGQRVRHSLIEMMNKMDGGEFHNSSSNIASFELSCSEPKTSSVVGTPSWSGVWRTLGVQKGQIGEVIRAVL